MPTQYDFSIKKIDDETALELEKVLASLAQKKQSCELEVSCKGGDVILGLKMMKLIKESPVTVNATVVGEAGSTAAVILQCCKIRRILEDATLHYHYGSWRVSWLIYYDKDLAERNRLKGMEYQQALIEPIALKAGISDEEVHQLLLEDRKLNAQEALNRRLVDEIIYSAIPCESSI